ncbi:MAG: hypothetical protein IJA48_00755 [Oscillospiraceae bacterium]|nr:hypothetical protein [Oscillospiraceae bacterium]
MQFGTFLGNDSLKERLSAALSKDRLSHCYLLTGPEGSGKRTLSTLLAAAMQCEALPAGRPCLRCSACRKVLSGTHPDVITVKKQKDRKTMGVEVIRRTCQDLYIRPNEGRKKIYIFPSGKEITPQAQNALLKGIEEPPSYGVFLFLAEQADHLLQTIRSRCAELKLSPLPAKLLEEELARRCPDRPEQARREAALRSGGFLGQAQQLLQQEESLAPQAAALLTAYAQKDPIALITAGFALERQKREALLELFPQCRRILSYALSSPSLHPVALTLSRGRSRSELAAAARAFSQALTLLQANVSPAHTCGNLMISLDSKE